MHLLRLATAIRERGFDPHAVSLAPPGPVSTELCNQGVPTSDCDAAGPYDVGVIRRLARHIRRVRPAIVHSFLFHGNLASRLAMPLAGGSSRRLICEIQTVEIERRWHLTVGGMTHRMCRCVVGNSPSVIEHLHRCAHMAASRLRCIPGGVDTAAMAKAEPPDRTAIGLKGNAPIVMWVGRMDPIKGLDELVTAFAELAKKTSAELVLIGDGPHESSVRTMISLLKLDDRVHLLGRRSDVASLLKLASVFAFPSYTEGMPNALLEAMAAGCPIVTTDVPGCRDVVEHRKSALLVRPGDATALCAAIAELLTNQPLARQLGAAAAADAESRFAFNACVDRYESLYRETLFTVPSPVTQ